MKNNINNKQPPKLPNLCNQMRNKTLRWANTYLQTKQRRPAASKSDKPTQQQNAAEIASTIPDADTFQQPSHQEISHQILNKNNSNPTKHTLTKMKQPDGAERSLL